MTRRVDATIQARMGSSRLPGKTLADIAGRPMLAWQIDRVRECLLIDRIIVATSEKAANDPIAELAAAMGVDCFRGSEEDVLGRVADALRFFEVDIHVELQGDNPMPDPLLVDAVVGFFMKHQTEFDCVTNALKTTYPPGSEVSVYPAHILLDLDDRVTDPDLREHVGVHIYQRPEEYRIKNLEAPSWLHAPEIHLEVDTSEDLELVRRVFDHFLPENPVFGLRQAIEFVRSEGLSDLNREVERRWRKYRKEEV